MGPKRHGASCVQGNWGRDSFHLFIHIVGRASGFPIFFMAYKARFIIISDEMTKEKIYYSTLTPASISTGYGLRYFTCENESRESLNLSITTL